MKFVMFLYVIISFFPNMFVTQQYQDEKTTLEMQL